MISLLSGNSRILLTVDERGSWAQLYYPHPGLHQHLLRARLGLFDASSKEFAWLDQTLGGPTAMVHLADSNVGRTQLQCLGVEIELDDMVHPNLDVVIRRIRIRNPGTDARRLRLFHYQSLSVGGSEVQGTAYWDAEQKTVNHYRRSYYFQFWGHPDFDHFTCGEHTLKGLQGSYVDAEDGALQGNVISHGAADSVVQWNVEVPPAGHATSHLFLAIERSRSLVNALRRGLEGKDPALYTSETIEYANHWMGPRKLAAVPEMSTRVHTVYDRSVFVMRDCQSTHGAIIASPDPRTLKSGGDNYNYNWWRDGAYVARAMSELGLHRNAVGFLRFAAKCQEEEGYFVHRHFPDGSVGSTWHPPPFLQVDQTASVIDAVRRYYECSGTLDELMPSWDLVRRAADFLMAFVDERGLPKPSYDLWEEKKAVNVYTVAATIRGLLSAATIGQALAKRVDYWILAAERMREAALAAFWNPAKHTFFKGLDPLDDAIDSAALLALLADLVPATDDRFARTVQTVEQRLWSRPHGGLARYEGDAYYGNENPWILCTLWLAQCHLRLGNDDRARSLIEWCAAHAGPTGLLAEQLDALTGEPTSVTPLVWSHSTFVETVNAYAQRAAARLKGGPGAPSVVAPDQEAKT